MAEKPILTLVSHCQITGCDMRATHQIVFRVWAKGHPDHFCDIEAGIVLCQHHTDEGTPPSDFFTVESKERINRGFRRLGKVELDFSTAKFMPRPLQTVG